MKLRCDSCRQCITHFIIALMLGFALCVSAFAHDNITGQLCQLENDANKAYIAHDRQFLSNLFADEFVHTNFRGGTVDKAAELDFFTSPKLTMKAAVVDHCTARKYGMLPWSRGSIPGPIPFSTAVI